MLNYVAAMEQGLARLDTLPFSLRLIRDMHAILLRGVRGRERLPGEFRTSQNWIGPPGSTIKTALFVPPPDEIDHLLSYWERYVHENRSVSVLVQSGLLHYQIETIHPFLDGNGRMGRLLIVFHLVLRQRLPQPLLYLSSYFERHRDTYYAMLQAVREGGDLDGWLRFYLRGVETQANDAVLRAERLIDLRESYRTRVIESTRGQAISLVDPLFANPIITAPRVERMLDVTRPTSLRILDRLRGLGDPDRDRAGTPAAASLHGRRDLESARRRRPQQSPGRRSLAGQGTSPIRAIRHDGRYLSLSDRKTWSMMD